jgi:hypothetical protein
MQTDYEIPELEEKVFLHSDDEGYDAARKQDDRLPFNIEETRYILFFAIAD